MHKVFTKIIYWDTTESSTNTLKTNNMETMFSDQHEVKLEINAKR